MTLVTMQIEGKDFVSFIPVRLSQAVKMAVSERTERSVRFSPWKPFDKTDDPEWRQRRKAAA